MSPRDPDRWQVDRKIPLALIGALLAQTFAAGWWGSGMQTRVDQLERQLSARMTDAERIVRLEEKVGGVQQGIAEIKAMLQRAAPATNAAAPRDPG